MIEGALKLKTFSVFKVFRNVKPNIIHLITMQPILIGGLLSLFFRRVFFVFAISGFGHIFNVTDFFSKIRKSLILSFYCLSLTLPVKKYIIVQNQRDYDFVLAFLKNQSLIHLIPGSGVMVKDFTPVPIPPYPPVLVFISRLLYTKGIYEFVEAASIITEQYPGSKFLIVGTPDFSNPSAISSDYLNSVSKLSYISYLGHRNDIYKIISDSHIVVLPSFYPRVCLRSFVRQQHADVL